MKRTIFTLLLIACATRMAAKFGFAIVIDPKSLGEARAEVEAYAKAVEQVNDLKTFIVEDRWGVPDSIRACLMQMHSEKQNPICGAVFIGDIPVAMVRDGQHLTSAFRMDQRRERKESSVPSDRFYDDFSLKFRYLDRDSDEALFYYSLTPQSAQRITPSIFSGRIRPTDCGGTSRYEKLRAYLRKATAAKLGTNRLDRAFYFTGSGSLSESKAGAVDEKVALYEHFPWMGTEGGSVEYMDHGQERYIKTRLMNELMRRDLDVAILHHHGDFDTQYLSRPAAKDADSTERARADLHLEDFAGYGFRPNCRFVIFDACYNGSFQRADCIANEYIFGGGETVCCVGGTVNVVQDKQYDKMLGLLGMGVEAGWVNAFSRFLESHVIGDPTFTFTPSTDAGRLGDVVAEAQRSGLTKKEYRRLMKSSVADVQVLAMELGAESGVCSRQDLLRLMKSPVGIVRMQALSLLAELGGDEFIEAVKLASVDAAEMVQRFSAVYMRWSGDERLAPALAGLLLKNNASERVAFDAMQAVPNFSADVLLPAFDSLAVGQLRVAGDSSIAVKRRQVAKNIAYWSKEVDQLKSDSISDKEFRFLASSLRLYLPQYRTADVLSRIRREPIADRKVQLLEALGWWRFGCKKADVAALARELQNNDGETPEVRAEAEKTLRRLVHKKD